MYKKSSAISKIMSCLFTILVIVVIMKSYQIYKKNYFGDFIKAENQMNISKFYRDSDITYSEYDSYKIESPTYNDAVFYKEFEVKPNTPYKVTCMVKTKDVVKEISNTDAGAMISLLDTTEVSESIIGTNDWQKLTFMFNSKDKETVKVGFRLGGNLGNCKGTAWFSDFKIEEGISDKSSEWKIACFIFKNMNIDENFKVSMDLHDVENIKSNMQRFANSCRDLSENKMSVEYDIIEIDEPITTLTYNEEHNYHVSPQDVESIISDIVTQNEYDHIIAVVRMGNGKNGISVNEGDWIGLRRNGIIQYWFFNNKIIN